PHAVAQFIGRPAIDFVAGAGEHDAILLARLAFGHQLARHVIAGADRIALEGIAPAAAAGGAENDAIAVADAHIVDLGRQRFAAAVLAHQPFLRAGRRAAAENAPWLRVMAIVVDRDFAVLEEIEDLFDAVAAAMFAGAAAVDDGRVTVDQ